jgi:cyclopropane fatty-acyl-phospholipid synthase-like methyltransferase
LGNRADGTSDRHGDVLRPAKAGAGTSKRPVRATPAPLVPRNGDRDQARCPSGPQVTAVRQYYGQTWLDYRVLWMSRRNYFAGHQALWTSSTRTHAEGLLEETRLMADRVGMSPSDVVLDAGCGVGGPAVWLAEKYGVSVHGITVVPAQVSRARRLAKRRRVDHLCSFSERDYLDTGFPDDSFDVVWAQESVCHATDKKRFLLEAVRVLRPGGRLIVLDGFRHARPYLDDDEAVFREYMNGWAIPDHPTGREFLSWAAEVGLTDVTMEDLSFRVWRSIRRLHRIAAVLQAGETALHLIGLRSSVQHGNVVGALRLWPAFQRHLWFLGLMTARKPGVPVSTTG